MIELNDGTMLDGHLMENGTGTMIFINLTGEISLAEGFALFNDPEKTCRIVFYDHGHEREYEGYTQLWAINNEFRNCNITMKRGD